MALQFSLLRQCRSLPRLDEIASLWNANAVGRHAFYPWTGNLLDHVFRFDAGDERGILCEARMDGRLVGFAHASYMHEYGYDPGGAVEAVLVDKPYRKQGIGTRLLEMAASALKEVTPRLDLIDALGAWPYGSLYTVLADGSERSGVFAREPELGKLFAAAGFVETRASLVMRAPTRPAEAKLPFGTRTVSGRRRIESWLDHVFRARELWDHNLADWRGGMLSRAIYGFMPGESRQAGKNIYSLFGVNTPPLLRGKGYGWKNIDQLLGHVGRLGGDLVEIHVYADNEPALALYKKCGFATVERTMMMRKAL